MTKPQSKETILLESHSDFLSIKDTSIFCFAPLLRSLSLAGNSPELDQLKNFSLEMDRQSVYACCCLCKPCTGTWFSQRSKVSTLHPPFPQEECVSGAGCVFNCLLSFCTAEEILSDVCSNFMWIPEGLQWQHGVFVQSVGAEESCVLSISSNFTEVYILNIITVKMLAVSS